MLPRSPTLMLSIFSSPKDAPEPGAPPWGVALRSSLFSENGLTPTAQRPPHQAEKTEHCRLDTANSAPRAVRYPRSCGKTNPPPRNNAPKRPPPYALPLVTRHTPLVTSPHPPVGSPRRGDRHPATRHSSLPHRGLPFSVAQVQDIGNAGGSGHR